MQIRRGVTRTVILTKRYAIKVPRLKHFVNSRDGKKFGNSFTDRLWSFCRGVLANQSEAQWSGYHEDLLPVLWSFAGLINVYPRVKPFEGDEYAAHEIWDDLEFKTPADTKPSNFGWHNGKLVWVDYDMNYNDCRRCGNEIS